MAKQDVQVKDVDFIRAFNRQFGDFLVLFTEHLEQFRRSLQEKLDAMEEAKRDIKRERAEIDRELSEARERYWASYNHGSYVTHRRPDGSTSRVFVPDQDYIDECREEYEHIDGPVYHNAQICEGLAHSKLMQSTQSVNLFLQRSDRLRGQFQNYVTNGRAFLDKAVQYIEQYKDKQPGA